MNHSFVPHRLAAALCVLALALLCGCGQAEAPSESAAQPPQSPADASGQAADDPNRLVVASSQNLAYGSCLPGKEQPPQCGGCCGPGRRCSAPREGTCMC